ncbi:hypothetical protein P1P68_06020 [Streptomyces scabiei]|uniref:hypothetical protein n=1 Tax=Streptomyces scabiei TaxID=1930 RepID=UPI00298F8CD3|nr:hypothetical protein [Streptomyces scabiei]MDW8804359.1 hypothetical protein [Streptomyces scabiei]
MHEPHFRPWGTVTPEYWATGDDSTNPGASAASLSQQAAPAQEPEPVAAARPQRKEPESPTLNSGAAATAEQTGTSGQTSPAAGEDGPPEEFRSRIASVTAAFEAPADRERLAAAGIEAEKLDLEITAQYGEQHANTVNIREIRGWLAHLSGQPGVAARWYLHTTGLQMTLHGANHPLAEGSVRRAVHTWQQVTDPAEVVQIGGDLARVAAAVLGEGSDIARFVQARLSRKQPQQ